MLNAKHLKTFKIYLKFHCSNEVKSKTAQWYAGIFTGIHTGFDKITMEMHLDVS